MKIYSIHTKIAAFILAFAVYLSPDAVADDVEDVMAAEIAFNVAQNRGDTVEMFSYLHPERTIYPPNQNRLFEGWTEESRQRRQAEFDAGRKITFAIEDLKARVYGDTAVTTFRRVGTVRAVNGTISSTQLLITGVWLRQGENWKLAHRHESVY